MAGLVVACLAALSPGQADKGATGAAGDEGVAADSPLSINRLVQRFDFEEPDNPDPMPLGWYKLAGAGYPNYTTVELARGEGNGKSRALKVKLNGGSAGAVLQAGRVAAVPLADYLITVFVKTAGAQRSRARLTAYFTDTNNQIIPASVVVSPPLVSNDQWAPLYVDLPGQHPTAAWIIIKLEMLQEDKYRPSVDAQAKVNIQDIEASAIFDDVSIYQLPQISIGTQYLTNLIRSPEKPIIIANVRDLTRQVLIAQLTVYDIHGRPISQTRQAFNRSIGRWVWHPEVDRYGWYWADLQILKGTRMVGRAITAFAYMPPLTGKLDDSSRFMIHTEEMPEKGEELLRDLMKRMGPSAVTLPLDLTVTSVVSPPGTPGAVTRPPIGTPAATPGPGAMRSQAPSPAPSPAAATPAAELTPAAMAEKRFHELLKTLVEDGHDVSLAIPRVPAAVAHQLRMDVRSPLDYFALESSLWQPYLEYPLARYSEFVSHWQVGTVDYPTAHTRDDLPELYGRIRNVFGQYVSNPRIDLPWQAQQGFPTGQAGPESFVLNMPAAVHYRYFGEYAALWPRNAKMTMLLDTLISPEYRHLDRAEDLALRMIHAWRIQPERVAIRQPWFVGGGGWDSGGGSRMTLLPDPMLPVWSNVSRYLSGRKFTGSIRLQKGVECHILNGPSGGMLVAWNHSTVDPVVPLRMKLGDQPMAYDVWGNSFAVAETAGKHKLDLSIIPLFINNVDIRLATFRSEFQLDPPFIESSYKVHDHVLNISNPWSESLTGTLQITGLEKWKIQPRHIELAIKPGQTVSVPLQLSFPVSQEAGEHLLTARVKFTTDRDYDVEISTPIEVGIKGIEFSATLDVRPNPEGGDEDVVVVQKITNVSGQPISLRAFARLGDTLPQERLVSQIMPDQVTLRRFRFPHAATKYRGQELRTGIRRLDAPSILNQNLQVP